MEVLGGDDLSIDTESAQHRDIGTEGGDIVGVNYSGESSSGKTAIAAYHFGPVLEVSEALEG